ncbi:MAG: GTPase HflX [Peptococcaceae bacterium]|nr:GTPase HflX [Peptococcaceae bacterium]
MTEEQKKSVYAQFAATAAFGRLKPADPGDPGYFPEFNDLKSGNFNQSQEAEERENRRGGPDRGFRLPQEQEPEKVLLLGLDFRRPEGQLSPAASLAELARLTETAGGIVAESLLVKRERPDPAHYVGKGKVEEINGLIKEKALDLVIVDDELSVRQQLKLDQQLECPVIDRSALILQIFADHARTSEGKLQVELAQLSYLLPRLTGKGKSLSRLGGGIGTRGPGETQLEKDRRHIRRRIETLKKEMEGVKKQRFNIRQRRRRNRLPVLALVGYTNAGKSTLLNKLTDSDVLAEDKLFATLDPSTRLCSLNGINALLTDTVGFIQRLPHSLITAFRATLEEALYSDVLLCVADASDPELSAQLRTVRQVLEEIGCRDKKMIHVFNKIDLVEDPVELGGFLTEHQPAVLISAATGQGLEELRQVIMENLPDPPVKVRFLLHQKDGAVLNLFYREGIVSQLEYLGEEISGQAILPGALAEKYKEFLTEEGGR